MSVSILLMEYVKGIEEFVKFVIEYVGDFSKIIYFCFSYCYVKLVSVENCLNI